MIFYVKTFLKHTESLHVLLGLSFLSKSITDNNTPILLILLLIFLLHCIKTTDPIYLTALYYKHADFYLTGKFLADKFYENNIRNADVYVKHMTGDELYDILQFYNVKHIFKNKETNDIERITIQYYDMSIEFSVIPHYGPSKITNMYYKINWLRNINDKDVNIETIEYFKNNENITNYWMPAHDDIKFNEPLQIVKILKDCSFWNLHLEKKYFDIIKDFSKSHKIPDKKINNVLMFDELFKFFNTSNSFLFIQNMLDFGFFDIINNYYLNLPIIISDNLQYRLKDSENKHLNFMEFLINVAKQNNVSLKAWLIMNNFNASKIISKTYLEFSCVISDYIDEYYNISDDYDYLIFLNKLNKTKLSVLDLLYVFDIFEKNEFITKEKIEIYTLRDAIKYPLCENEINMEDNFTLNETFNVSFKEIKNYKKNLLLKIYSNEIENDYAVLMKDFENTFKR